MVCDKNYFTYISWSQRSFILQGDNNTKSYLQDFQKSKKLKRKIKANVTFFLQTKLLLD